MNTINLKSKNSNGGNPTRIVMQSKMPGAEEFQDRVYRVVLPSIQKDKTHTATQTKPPEGLFK